MGSVSRGGQGRVRAGKMEREGPSTYLGPWLEQGGGGAGRPREAGVADGGACGGGVARPEKGLRVAVELVGVVSYAGSLFIDGAGRWRRGVAVMVAGELDGAPLMAFGVVGWRCGRRGRNRAMRWLGQGRSVRWALRAHGARGCSARVRAQERPAAKAE